MEIAIVSLETPNIRCYSEMTVKNKQEYCERWGYDFVNYTGSLNTRIDIMWSKIIALLKNIRKYEYLFWIDADAAILNQGIDLETLMGGKRLESGKRFFVTCDENHLNAGVMFIRCCEYSEKALEHVLKLQPEFEKHPWKDTAAFQYYYHTDADFVKSVDVPPKRLFNSYIDDYRQGDFILHLPSMVNRMREVIFRNLIPIDKKIIIT